MRASRQVVCRVGRWLRGPADPCPGSGARRSGPPARIAGAACRRGAGGTVAVGEPDEAPGRCNRLPLPPARRRPAGARVGGGRNTTRRVRRRSSSPTPASPRSILRRRRASAASARSTSPRGESECPGSGRRSRPSSRSSREEGERSSGTSSSRPASPSATSTSWSTPPAGRCSAGTTCCENLQTGHAKLYNPNPVVEHHGAKGLRRDHHDRDTPLLRKLRRKVSLPNIDDGQDCLRGRWVHALRGKKDKETCKPSLRWNKVTRSDSRFEALMVYFQINRSQAYIQSLGFSNSNPTPNGIDDRVQRATADAFKRDNSFYSPATQSIVYGSGGVDDAEDGDVILHEYGHALQDSSSPSFGHSSGFQPGALAEGSSDYWAAAMSSLVPHTSNEDDVCIFDWDATTYGKFFPRVPGERSGRRCGRRADSSRRLQKAEQGSCGTDVHCVGQVWSTALWNLRRSSCSATPATVARRWTRSTWRPSSSTPAPSGSAAPRTQLRCARRGPAPERRLRRLQGRQLRPHPPGDAVARHPALSRAPPSDIRP